MLEGTTDGERDRQLIQQFGFLNVEDAFVLFNGPVFK